MDTFPKLWEPIQPIGKPDILKSENRVLKTFEFVAQMLVRWAILTKNDAIQQRIPMVFRTRFPEHGIFSIPIRKLNNTKRGNRVMKTM